jgi:hypothetical protein
MTAASFTRRRSADRSRRSIDGPSSETLNIFGLMRCSKNALANPFPRNHHRDRLAKPRAFGS